MKSAAGAWRMKNSGGAPVLNANRRALGCGLFVDEKVRQTSADNHGDDLSADHAAALSLERSASR